MYKRQPIKFTIQQADPSKMFIHQYEDFGKEYVIFEKKGKCSYDFITVLYPELIAVDKDFGVKYFEYKDYDLTTITVNEYTFHLYRRKNYVKDDFVETDAKLVLISKRYGEPYSVMMYDGSKISYDKLNYRFKSNKTVTFNNINDNWSILEIN